MYKKLASIDTNSLAVAPPFLFQILQLVLVTAHHRYFLRSPLPHISTTLTTSEIMRASTAVAILSLTTWVALSVALPLPLPAFKYASLSCCICDAQVLFFFADLRSLGKENARTIPFPPLSLVHIVAHPGHPRSCPGHPRGRSGHTSTRSGHTTSRIGHPSCRSGHTPSRPGHPRGHSGHPRRPWPPSSTGHPHTSPSHPCTSPRIPLCAKPRPPCLIKRIPICTVLTKTGRSISIWIPSDNIPSLYTCPASLGLSRTT